MNLLITNPPRLAVVLSVLGLFFLSGKFVSATDPGLPGSATNPFRPDNPADASGETWPISAVHDEGWFESTEYENRFSFRQILLAARIGPTQYYLLWETVFHKDADGKPYNPNLGIIADAFEIVVSFVEEEDEDNAGQLFAFIAERGYTHRRDEGNRIAVRLPVVSLEIRDQLVSEMENLEYVKYAEPEGMVYFGNPVRAHYPSPFWVNPIDVTSQMRSTWLGWVYDWNFPWVYSPSVGWIFVPIPQVWNPFAPMDLYNPEFFCYSVELGWVYAMKGIYPWLYSTDRSSWVYLVGDWLYQSSDGTWSPWRNESDELR